VDEERLKTTCRILTTQTKMEPIEPRGGSLVLGTVILSLQTVAILADHTEVTIAALTITIVPMKDGIRNEKAALLIEMQSREGATVKNGGEATVTKNVVQATESNPGEAVTGNRTVRVSATIPIVELATTIIRIVEEAMGTARIEEAVREEVETVIGTAKIALKEEAVEITTFAPIAIETKAIMWVITA
jgi:hypothetical protein